MRFRLLLVVSTLLAPLCGFAPGADSASRPAAPHRPYPEIEHVCIISIDGLRPDRALLANTPNLHAMVQHGTYTFWAKTTPNAITLPSHMSMLSGVSPRKHGVEWNRDLPFSEPVYPLVPTIFELATRAGYTTAVVAGKSKFAIFNKPGALTYAEIAKTDTSTDQSVGENAVGVIEAHRPQLLFIHFPEVDNWGHGKGWGSPEQLAAIERVDVELGKVRAALERAGVLRSTLMIVTADHGGSGRSHGPDDFRSRYIPWIVTGPGIREHLDLTQFAELEVVTEDTAATALYVLGIPIPKYFDGKPELAAFAEPPR